ncbi:MAG: hypothetical protein IAF58_13770 [Leptolyngbya sp.]|nr:hypothetical protein [Candidatus Melainabacteria bacterium]
MEHQSFDKVNALASFAEAFARFIPRAYELNVKPNAVFHGLLVEANERDEVVAVQYSPEESVRNHFDYLIYLSKKGNALINKNSIVHPLD